MITRFRTMTLLLIVVLALASCQTPAAAPAEPAAAPNAEAIVQALADALNAGDVDAAVALIADDAVFDMADGEPLMGVDQFRELFAYLVAGHFRIEATPKNTDGGTVTTDTKTWGDGIPGGGPNIATEVYVVEDGKITSISWTPNEETTANMEAAAMEGGEAKAEPAQPAFTITFDGDQCMYDGPDTLPSGQRIKTVLDVTDQDAYENYGFAVVTLYGDKTMADLEAWPSADQPPWTKLYSITFSDDVSPQSTRVEDDAWLVDGPIYLVCFTATDQEVFKSDVVGPIEVAAAQRSNRWEEECGERFVQLRRGSRCLTWRQVKQQTIHRRCLQPAMGASTFFHRRSRVAALIKRREACRICSRLNPRSDPPA